MKKYKTRKYNVEIEEVEVIRETAQFVFVVGYKGHERREGKNTEFDTYFDTWEEAHSSLLRRVTNALKNAQSEFDEVNGLKKPD